MDLIEKAKGFLSEPTRAFETSKEEPLEEAVKYYLFGWIWVGALNVVGLHQYQDLPEGKAILIIIVSVIIPMAITGF